MGLSSTWCTCSSYPVKKIAVLRGSCFALPCLFDWIYMYTYMHISCSALQQLLTRLMWSTSVMEKLHTGLTRGETNHIWKYMLPSILQPACFEASCLLHSSQVSFKAACPNLQPLVCQPAGFTASSNTPVSFKMGQFPTYVAVSLNFKVYELTSLELVYVASLIIVWVWLDY